MTAAAATTMRGWQCGGRCIRGRFRVLKVKLQTTRMDIGLSEMTPYVNLNRTKPLLYGPWCSDPNIAKIPEIETPSTSRRGR